MTIVLASNSYGKSAVRLLKVQRSGTHHVIREFAVDIALTGAFDAAHTEGDNSSVLPTDTMKNTVYAKARELELDAPEDFGIARAQHFLGASAAASSARVTVTEHGWRRLDVDGVPHERAFERRTGELRIARGSRGDQRHDAEQASSAGGSGADGARQSERDLRADVGAVRPHRADAAAGCNQTAAELVISDTVTVVLR